MIEQDPADAPRITDSTQKVHLVWTETWADAPLAKLNPDPLPWEPPKFPGLNSPCSRSAIMAGSWALPWRQGSRSESIDSQSMILDLILTIELNIHNQLTIILPLQSCWNLGQDTIFNERKWPTKRLSKVTGKHDRPKWPSKMTSKNDLWVTNDYDVKESCLVWEKKEKESSKPLVQSAIHPIVRPAQVECACG